MRAFLGIDVGTGSARAGVFDERGRLIGCAKQSVAIWKEQGEIVEQSSENIWDSVCLTVKAALKNTRIDAASISGIGVGATCSLVVLDANSLPLAVGPSENPQRNVIVWMDHRAMDQANRINATKHSVLQFVGGEISPEMETPKLLWLKENRPEIFARAAHFFDLSDYLTWRLTGSLARSICTVTCKWTYLAHEKSWDETYFRQIGLSELVDDKTKIGVEFLEPGKGVGIGLSQQAAEELGLQVGTPVGAALIDAHAGGIGTVGAEGVDDAKNCLAYIFGTSACAMATTEERTNIDGIWGPYYSAMIPGKWLNEAGQSAAGAAIDQLVEMHAAAPEAKALASKDGIDLVTYLERLAISASLSLSAVAERARHLHVVPEFNGNRSPYADPKARAIISGLNTDRSIDGLVDLYVAGLCGLGYGLSQIVEALKAKGVDIKSIIVSGGATKSKLVRQILADTTELPIFVPRSEEPVLLGAAMLGATAAGAYPSLEVAMRSMARIESICSPSEGQIRELHSMKRSAFNVLQATERTVRSLVSE